MTADRDWLFEVTAEKQWCAVVAVRAGRAGKIAAADITWASRVLEALATAGRPMTIAEMMAIAIRDGAPNRRSGMDAAIRHLNGQGLIAPAHRQWAFQPAWATWFKGRAADGRAIEVRLGVAIAGPGGAVAGRPPGRGNSTDRLQPGSIWVEEGLAMMKEMVPDFLHLRDEASDDDLLRLQEGRHTNELTLKWCGWFIERRKAAGTWAPSQPVRPAQPVPAKVVRPKGWPEGLPTRAEYSSTQNGARELYEIPRGYTTDAAIEALTVDESVPSDFRTVARILRAERQLAGTWSPVFPSAEVIRHPAAVEPTDEPSPDEAFDNPHHGHEDEAEVIDSPEPDDGTPAAIMVEIDGVMSNAATMSHARLDQLIGQAHAGMVDCSPVDLVTMEAEFERRALAAGEEGLDLGEDRSWEG